MIYWNDLETVSSLKQTLDQNKIVLVSGDTVLGLCGRLTRTAFEGLNDIKGRQEKPYLVIIGSLDRLHHFIDQELTDQLQTLIETCWPGSVTLIFKARKDLPSWLVSAQGTIALRVPDHPGLLDLLQYYDGLFSTSANKHQEPIPEAVSLVHPDLLHKVGSICLERNQIVYPLNPSTILDCSQGTIQVVRSGAFNVDLIKDLIV